MLKLEWRKMLKGGPLFAVVCETLAAGKRPVRTNESAVLKSRTCP